MVIEGGWSSDSTITGAWNVTSQRRYMEREAALLDRAAAIGWFQITFADLDMASLGLPPSAAPFASLGLVDVDLNPKPSLDSWNVVFGRARR